MKKVILLAKAQVKAHTRKLKDGRIIQVNAYENRRQKKPAEASSAKNGPGLKTEMHPTLGMRVPVKVIFDENQKGMKFSIDDDGQAVLRAAKIFETDKQYIIYRGFRAIDRFLWPFGDDVYFRTHNKKADYEHLAAGTHKGSKNHATDEDEGGLSVARGLEYAGNYAYLVRGKEIGQGSDSEPLLETSSAKAVSKQMRFADASKMLREAIKERSKSLGISPEALVALRTAADYSFGQKKPSAPPPALKPKVYVKGVGWVEEGAEDKTGWVTGTKKEEEKGWITGTKKEESLMTKAILVVHADADRQGSR